MAGEYRRPRIVISGYEIQTLLAIVLDAGFRILESKVETQSKRGYDVPYLWMLA